MSEFRVLIYNSMPHPSYGISQKGEIKHLPSGRIKKLTKNARGYWVCNLHHNTLIRAHKALAETWIPNPSRYSDVNHIDGDPSNLALENLEWVTHAENVARAYKDGYAVYPRRGAKHQCAKLNQEQRNFIIKNYVRGSKDWNQASLAAMFGVSPSAIKGIVNNEQVLE